MLPTPFTVLTRAHSGTGEGDDGNSDDTWATPVEQRVVTYYSETSVEPAEAGRQAVVTDVIVLAGPDFRVGAYDKVILPVGPLEGEYTVEGLPDDYTHNPFGALAGFRVHLKRVTG